MFLTFAELERRAYINGRTYLAKAYAAADDAEHYASGVLDRVGKTEAQRVDLAREIDKQDAVLKQAIRAIEDAQTLVVGAMRELTNEAEAEAVEINNMKGELQLGLEV